MKANYTNLPNVSNRIALDDEIREKLLDLGSLRWSTEDIADYFGWDRKALKVELSDPSSEISRLIRRGELSGQFSLESDLFNKATSSRKGSGAAFKSLQKIMRDRSFKHTKLDLFGAAEDSDIFEIIQKYYESGCQGELSQKEQTYLDLLQIIYSFDHQYGKRKTIKILTSKPFELSYENAAELYANAMEMFNSGRHNTKDAMRWHTADQLDTLYHSVLERATCTKDYEIAANILEQRAKLLRLDEPEEQQLPDEQYQKTFRLLTITPESIGLPAANRDILAAQIDSLDDVPDSEKERLRMEAGVDDVDITKILNNVVQEAR